MMDTTTTSREEVPPLSVDFLCEPRVALKSKCIKTTATTLAPPRVHFSKFSQMFIIPYDDVESKWYTQEEQRHFYQACLSDIHRLRVMLRDAAPALMSEYILYECGGLTSSVEMRQAHSEAVLSAQRTYQGDHGSEKLSETSKRSSKWARKRAAKVAAIHASSFHY